MKVMPSISYYVISSRRFLPITRRSRCLYGTIRQPVWVGGDFKAGDIRYADVNGDGTLNGDDRVICNSTEPVYTFGLNLNAGWKGFDLSLMFNGAAKVARLFDALRSIRCLHG